MNEFIADTGYFSVALALLLFFFFSRLQQKCRINGLKPLLSPLVITEAIIIVFLALTGSDYESFNEGAKYITWFLTPTTVCLAIPLYERIGYLKREPAAIMTAILAGIFTSAVSIFGMAVLFGISQAEYITMLPKSVTAAVGMDLSAALGGYEAITMAAITVTGLLGNVTATYVFKLFRITDPVAQGLALGNAAHALGTSRAAELGKTQEAMSSLAMGVAGLLTVLVAALFSMMPV